MIGPIEELPGPEPVPIPVGIRRITEDDDSRVTEDGDQRATEANQ